MPYVDFLNTPYLEDILTLTDINVKIEPNKVDENIQLLCLNLKHQEAEFPAAVPTDIKDYLMSIEQLVGVKGTHVWNRKKLSTIY